MIRRTIHRNATHRFNSFYNGRQWPNQMYHPPSLIVQQTKPPATQSEDQEGTTTNNNHNLVQHNNNNNYVPLYAAANLELQADYMSESMRTPTSKESAHPMAMKAVQYLGIVVASYAEFYNPTGDKEGILHHNLARVYIKLARAFRLAGMHDSGLKVIENGFRSDHLENVLEASIEKALLLECLKTSTPKDIGELYESTMPLLYANHDLGNSERYTRL
eukprot:PhF_6_TR19966/c0_g1_i2/m.29108